jgi:hypothetical protein
MACTPRLLTAVAAVALALAAPAATLAHTAVVPDPDEPSLLDRYDIEWVAVEHPPSVSGRIVRHTIKTRAPYGPARTPWLYLRASSEPPGKYRNYRIRGTMMLAKLVVMAGLCLGEGGVRQPHASAAPFPPLLLSRARSSRAVSLAKGLA